MSNPQEENTPPEITHPNSHKAFNAFLEICTTHNPPSFQDWHKSPAEVALHGKFISKEFISEGNTPKQLEVNLTRNKDRAIIVIKSFKPNQELVDELTTAFSERGVAVEISKAGDNY